MHASITIHGLLSLTSVCSSGFRTISGDTFAVDHSYSGVFGDRLGNSS